MTLAFVGPIAVFIYLASLRKSLNNEKKKNKELRKEITQTEQDAESHQKALIDLRKKQENDSLTEEDRVKRSIHYLNLVDRMERLTYDKDEKINSLKSEIRDVQRSYQQIVDAYTYDKVERAAQHISNNVSSEIFDKLTRKFTEHISNFRDQLTNRSFKELAEEQEKFIPEIIENFQQCKSKFEDKPILFPNNCRLLYSTGKRTLMVIEQEPMVRNLFFSHSLRDTETGGRLIENPHTGNSYYSYNLALPFFYFFLIFDKDRDGIDRLKAVKLAFANKRIENKDSILYTVPLPNTEIDGHDISDMCMGHEFYYGSLIDEEGQITDDSALKSNHSINEQAKIAVDHYWTRVFNNDRGNGGYCYVGDDRIRTLEKWEESSQEDPFFPLTVSWRCGNNLNHYITRLLNERSVDIQRYPDDHIEIFLKDRLQKIIFASSERLESDYREFMDAFRTDEESQKAKINLQREFFDGFVKMDRRLRRNR